MTWTHCAAPSPCPNFGRPAGVAACACRVDVEAETGLSGAPATLSRPNASQRLRDALAEQNGAVRRNDDREGS